MKDIIDSHEEETIAKTGSMVIEKLSAYQQSLDEKLEHMIADRIAAQQ